MAASNLSSTGLVGGVAWTAASAFGWVVLGAYLMNEHFEAKREREKREASITNG